jgi:purine-binding chemotaxis protein CheW
MPLVPEMEIAGGRGPTIQLCTFTVGTEDHAVDVMRVAEIIQPLRVTAVPRAPAFVEGVIDLHGSMVPMIDLRHRFGFPPTPPSKKTKHLICRIGQKRVGLVVDAVKGNLRVPRSAVKPAPAMLGGGAQRYFAGMVASAGGILLLLNVKALLDSEEPMPSIVDRARAREQQ